MSFTHDHVVHVVGAQERLNGRGISAATVDPSDFASFAYRPIVEWPPGYSATLSVALSLFGDVVDAVVALDFLLIAVCFGSWWWLIYQARKWLGYRLRVFLCGWWVVVASPAWNLGHSDLYSLAFFILSTALTVETVRRRSMAFAAATGLAIGLAALSRYAYWPLIAVSPIVMLMIRGGWRRNLKLAMVQGGTAASLVSIAVVRNLLISSGGVYIPDSSGATGLQINLERLLDLVPFPIAVLGAYPIYAPGGLIEGVNPFLRSSLTLSVWIVSAAILAFSGLGLFKLLRTPRAENFDRPEQVLEVLAAHSVLTTAVTLGLLTILSVTLAPREYPSPGDTWVYVAEARYFVPLTAALLFGLAIYSETLSPESRFARPLLSATVLLLCLLSAPAAAMRAKRFAEANLAGEPTPRIQRAYLLREAFEEQFRPHHDRGVPIVYLDEDTARGNWARMAGAAAPFPSDIGEIRTSISRDVAVILAAGPSSSSATHIATLWKQLEAAGGKPSGTLGDIKFLTYSASR